MSKDKEEDDIDNLSEILPSKLNTPESVVDLENQLLDDVLKKKMVRPQTARSRILTYLILAPNRSLYF